MRKLAKVHFGKMETMVIRKCDRLTNLPTSQQTRVGAYRSKKMVIAQPFFSAAPNFFVALLFGAKPFICGNRTPQCIHLLLPTPQRTRRSLTIQALRVVRIFILYSVFFRWSLILTWNGGSWIWIVSLWFPLFSLASVAHPVFQWSCPLHTNVIHIMFRNYLVSF